jgi:hypothetical protein
MLRMANERTMPMNMNATGITYTDEGPRVRLSENPALDMIAILDEMLSDLGDISEPLPFEPCLNRYARALMAARESMFEVQAADEACR